MRATRGVLKGMTPLSSGDVPQTTAASSNNRVSEWGKPPLTYPFLVFFFFFFFLLTHGAPCICIKRAPCRFISNAQQCISISFLLGMSYLQYSQLSWQLKQSWKWSFWNTLLPREHGDASAFQQSRSVSYFKMEIVCASTTYVLIKLGFRIDKRSEA